MKLRCLIVDDEPLAHEVILRYIEDVPFLQTAGQCYLATEALSFLGSHQVDLVFLDIRMPKLSGLEFLRTLQQRPLVIITSAYQEHALESFDLEVCDYLLKPFRFDRFLKAANRALSLYSLRQQPAPSPQTKPAPVPDASSMYIKSDKKLVQLPFDEVWFLESLGNYVKVWNEQKYMLTPRTLTSFESQLPPENFVRVHKSYIINRKYLHYIDGNMIRLKNGKTLPLGKSYRQTVKQLLSS